MGEIIILNEPIRGEESEEKQSNETRELRGSFFKSKVNGEKDQALNEADSEGT
jgi:hypothetical protein